MGLGEKHLERRRNVWWFRKAIPAVLRPHFDGLTIYLRNLQTRDLKVAKRRRDEEAAKIEALFDDLRNGVETDARKTMASEAAWWASEEGQAAREAERGAGAWDAAAEDMARHDAKHGTRHLAAAHGRQAVDDPLKGHLMEANVAPKTKAERRTMVKDFAAWAGKKGVSLPTLPRRRAAEYFETQLLPMHRNTAAKRLSNLKSYWGWLLERGHAEGENPWAALKMPVERKGRAAKKEDAERPFTDAEVKKLFQATPTGSAESAKRLKDAMHIGALSGMRIEEICQLTAGDCRGGVFRIREGKTDSAARSVPIHSALTAIVEERLKGKDAGDRLFSDVAGKGHTLSDPLSKQFGRFIRTEKVADLREGHRRSKVNFHSFRRWFVTKAEQAGQPPHVISAVVGHVEGRQGMTLGTYSAGPAVDQLRAVVEAVKLPDLQSKTVRLEPYSR